MELAVQPGSRSDLGSSNLFCAGAGQVQPDPAPLGGIGYAVDLPGEDEAIDQRRTGRHADPEVVGEGRQARAGVPPNEQQGSQLGNRKPARAGSHLLANPAHRPGHDLEHTICDVDNNRGVDRAGY